MADHADLHVPLGSEAAQKAHRVDSVEGIGDCIDEGGMEALEYLQQACAVIISQHKPLTEQHWHSKIERDNFD